LFVAKTTPKQTIGFLYIPAFRKWDPGEIGKEGILSQERVQKY